MSKRQYLVAIEPLPCGHPAGCAGQALDGVGCGWCADLADMGVLVDHLSLTYDEFSGGRISKPFTRPEEVFSVAHELEDARIEEAVKEELEDAVEEKTAELRALATELAGSLSGMRAWQKENYPNGALYQRVPADYALANARAAGVIQ